MEPKTISRDMLPRVATKTANETRPRISASDCQKGISAFQKPLRVLTLKRWTSSETSSQAKNNPIRAIWYFSSRRKVARFEK